MLLTKGHVHMCRRMARLHSSSSSSMLGGGAQYHQQCSCHHSTTSVALPQSASVFSSQQAFCQLPATGRSQQGAAMKGGLGKQIGLWQWARCGRAWVVVVAAGASRGKEGVEGGEGAAGRVHM